jgi:hypothetical protein
VILASLVGGLLLAAATAAPAAASPRLCFYDQERNVTAGAYTGHAFVQLLPDRGSQAGNRNLVYGFYPKHQWLAVTGGPGKFETDNEHRWDWKLCKTVTVDAYNKAEEVVNHDRNNVPNYSLLGFNCTDWVFKVAEKAGVNLPSASTLGTNVRDPEAWFHRLRELWQQQGGRNIPGGDAVWKNTTGAWPNNVADPPSHVINLDSYTDITLLAFTDPRLIAHAMDMTARTAVVSPVTVGANRTLLISLAGLGAKPTVTEVQFGDGSRQYQKRTFTHTYRRPGVYRLRGIAIANATLYRFSLQVRVVRGAGAASTTTTVPHNAPHHYHFPAPRPVIWPLPI